MKNKLLEEYNNQIKNVLDEKENKIFNSYAFYNVYEVTIGGYETSGGGFCITCCCVLFIGANVCMGVTTGQCCFGGL